MTAMRPLVKYLDTKSGGVVPGHDVDKIRGLVAVGVLVVLFAGDSEGRDGDAGLCTAELRVAGKAAYDRTVVQHSFFLHLRLLNIFHLILGMEPAQCLDGVGKKHEDVHLVFLRGLPRFVWVVPQFLEKFGRIPPPSCYRISYIPGHRGKSKPGSVFSSETEPRPPATGSGSPCPGCPVLSGRPAPGAFLRHVVGLVGERAAQDEADLGTL